MRCPFCQKPMLQVLDDKVKLRSPVLIFSKDGTKCSAVCSSCKQEVEVPVTLAPGAIQSAARSRITLNR